jgi:hypothetical protein
VDPVVDAMIGGERAVSVWLPWCSQEKTMLLCRREIEREELRQVRIWKQFE